MCAFRIASLFSRNVAAKNTEPTAKTSIRNKNPIEEKRTSASVHVNSQFDSEATKNIKDNLKARISAKPSGAGSEKIGFPLRDNASNEKLSGIDIQISVANDIQERIDKCTIHSRFSSEEYEKLWEEVPAKGKELGRTYNLDACEMAAIRCYSMEKEKNKPFPEVNYQHINTALRSLNGKDVDFYNAGSLQSFGVDKHLSEIISDLANGLRKLPPAQSNGDMFRGIGRDVSLPAEVLSSYREGEIISDLGFTSTTSTLEQMVDSNWWERNDQALVIHQRTNGNGRDIAAFSAFNKEREILFLPNTKFKVTYRNDDGKVGYGVNWDKLKDKLIKIFLDEFPQVYGENLGMVLRALGESFPLDLDSAKKVMEEIFDPVKFTVNLDELRSEFGRLHAEAYGGTLDKDVAAKKVVIAMTEISSDEESKISFEALATSEKELASNVPTNTPRPEESERKIPLRGKSTQPAKNEGKIPVRNQSKRTPQPNPAAKPSRTNKAETKPNFRNDEYSISDASNYDGEYFPGFRE
jgi:NAD:arginine ADP-ribosyltransferase